MKVALVVGHTEDSPGASNENGTKEWNFNDILANHIDTALENKLVGFEIEIVYRDTLEELPKKINNLKPDFIVSLHCNAFNKTATGCETLYYHKSKKGKEAAEIFQKNIVAALGNRDRGIKPKGSEDRGGYLLKMTNAPCILCEPFFIDSDEDLQNANRNLGDLVDAYAESIIEFSNTLPSQREKEQKILEGNDANLVELKNLIDLTLGVGTYDPSYQANINLIKEVSGKLTA